MENTVSNLLIDLEVQGMVMHQRDINARRAAELDGQRHAEELARSDARLEEFAYTAAHDLREPLRAIGPYTEMLLRRTPMDTESKQMASFIKDGVTRMATLVNDLMSYTVNGVHCSGQPVALRDAVAQAIQNLELQIEESGATITIEALPNVRSNQIQLVRVFQNLICNAIQYRGADPVTITISAERDGSKWFFKVKDNGIGISLEDQVSIFTAFKRLAKVDVPGSGLGLAVCKKIVEGLGGAISVKSEFGSGSTFMFTVGDPDGMTESTAA